MASHNVIDIKAARNKKEPSKRKRKPISTRRKRQIRRKIITYVIVILVVFAIIGGLGYKIISLKLEQSRLQKEQINLKNQREELKTEKKDVRSLDYIEEQARKKLHLVLPGEILYVLPDEEGKKTDEK